MSKAEGIASMAVQALDRRAEYPYSAESEATAGVAYALLAIFEQLSAGVLYVKDADRV